MYILLFSIFCRSSIMTKRDSNTANLPSPRDLRMASYDVDMSTVAPHSYTTATLSTPGPDSHPQASSSHIHPSQQLTPFPQHQLPHTMQRGEYRQRVGHSTVFKVLEEVLPSGQPSISVIVEETDSNGYMKRKSLEFYFNGIIGHLRDRWGYTLDCNTLCSQLANYWRSWFGAPTVGPVFEPYADSQPWVESEQSSVPAPVITPDTTTPDPSSGMVLECSDQRESGNQHEAHPRDSKGLSWTGSRSSPRTR